MPRMLSDGRRLGVHLPLALGMVRAVDRAAAIGAEAIQVFADNPTAWRRRPEPPIEQAAFRERLLAADIHPVAVHASYLVNLAGRDDRFFQQSVELLASELTVAPGFLARYVNVHTGSHRGAGLAEGIARLADGVARTMAAVPDGPDASVLVLENSAGGGDAVGSSVEELATIAAAVADRGVPSQRLGFCLDAAHAWGAGIDISDPAVIDALLEDIDRRIGIERLVMVHLNDSRAELGSRNDRHEHIGAGRIGATGLAHLLCHPALAKAVFILETPGMDVGYDAINLERARDLVAGRPLSELPPEAFELGGSRSRTGPPPEPVA